MDDAIILNTIVALWENSGAKLLNPPERMSYLTKQKRPDKPRLYLSFGIPLALYMPDAIYNFKTREHGNVSKFADEFLQTFEYRVISPENAWESLARVMLSNFELIISIESLKS